MIAQYERATGCKTLTDEALLLNRSADVVPKQLQTLETETEREQATKKKLVDTPLRTMAVLPKQGK